LPTARSRPCPLAATVKHGPKVSYDGLKQENVTKHNAKKAAIIISCLHQMMTLQRTISVLSSIPVLTIWFQNGRFFLTDKRLPTPDGRA
jgi:hypothetical protein